MLSSCPFLKNGFFRMHLLETSDIRQAAAFFLGTRAATVFKKSQKSHFTSASEASYAYSRIWTIIPPKIKYLGKIRAQFLECDLRYFWWISNTVISRPFKNHLGSLSYFHQENTLSKWGFIFWDISSIVCLDGAQEDSSGRGISLHFLVSVIWYQGFHKNEKVLLFWLG